MVSKIIKLFCAGNEDMYSILDDSNFGQIWPPTTELAALERRKKIP